MTSDGFVADFLAEASKINLPTLGFSSGVATSAGSTASFLSVGKTAATGGCDCCWSDGDGFASSFLSTDSTVLRTSAATFDVSLILEGLAGNSEAFFTALGLKDPRVCVP